MNNQRIQGTGTRPFITETAAMQAVLNCRFPIGLAATNDNTLRKHSLYIRDYLSAMSDLMDIVPDIVRDGFCHIPQEQGVKFDPLTEEQPGCLPQQVSYTSLGGIFIPDEIISEQKLWADLWGIPYDTDKGIVVYNATDNIRYLIELQRYCAKYGKNILTSRFMHRPSSNSRTVAEASLLLLDWIVKSIERSEANGIGLYEVAGTNFRQTSWTGVMRSAIDAYYHPEKEYDSRINRSQPVAYIENQGIAVGALLAGAELFPEHENSKKWKRLASVLPARTVELFRMEDENYFVPAVDRDASGAPRQVKLLSSAPMELLATPFFEQLRYGTELLEGIVNQIFSPGFMTPVGVRMLHLRHEHEENGYYAYQGSGVVWGVTQRRIAAGLREHGLFKHAHNLGMERFVSGIEKSQNFLEYWFVDRQDGYVNYHPLEEAPRTAITIPTIGLPNQTSLWTATGALAELKAVSMRYSTPSSALARKIEARYDVNIKHLPVPAHNDKNMRQFYIDFEEGKRLASKHIQRVVGDAIFSKAHLDIGGRIL